MKNIFFLLITTFLISSKVLCNIVSGNYISYIQHQIDKKDFSKLNLNNINLFTSANSKDSVIVIPYRKGNSFLLFEVKLKKIVFVEFAYITAKNKKSPDKQGSFLNNLISIYSTKRDTVKKLLLDSSMNNTCTELKIYNNQQLVTKWSFDNSSLSGKTLVRSTPAVIQYMPDSIACNADKQKTLFSPEQHIFFNIDWFLTFNDNSLLDNDKKTIYTQRFISFTAFKNEIIEVEYSNPENLKPIDLKKSL